MDGCGNRFRCMSKRPDVFGVGAAMRLNTDAVFDGCDAPAQLLSWGGASGCAVLSSRDEPPPEGTPTAVGGQPTALEDPRTRSGRRPKRQPLVGRCLAAVPVCPGPAGFFPVFCIHGPALW